MTRGVLRPVVRQTDPGPIGLTDECLAAAEALATAWLSRGAVTTRKDGAKRVHLSCRVLRMLCMPGASWLEAEMRASRPENARTIVLLCGFFMEGPSEATLPGRAVQSRTIRLKARSSLWNEGPNLRAPALAAIEELTANAVNCFADTVCIHLCWRSRSVLRRGQRGCRNACRQQLSPHCR